MIPAYFSQVDSIPLTPNGKVDKKALCSHEKMGSGVAYAAARNEIEKALVQVWQEVLGREQIGINNNYFSEGGDSIKAIQVASRLQKQNLKMRVKDLFQHPTIAELSSYIKPADEKAQQTEVVGQVRLTPIQKWFFESLFTNMHHFNHSVMLHNHRGFDDKAVEKVFTKIVQHHDALRMVYRMQDGHITQYNRAAEGELLEFKVIEIAGEEDCAARIEKEANSVQSGINLTEGPLLKLRLFKTPKGDHLLITVHHLVIDGVSWRIILEDFASGYMQALQGEPIVFQEKTHSFKDWAEKLHAYAAGEAAAKEAEYWKNVCSEEIPLLPRDIADKDADRVKDSEDIVIILSEEETEILLKQVHTAYNTEINDILVAAMGLAFKQWCGQDKLGITMEGHGREELVDGMDITRTVGWFTSKYPVVLDMKNSHDTAFYIKSVKEQLHRIPNNGIGYGILEYLCPDTVKQAIDFRKKPQISFNYLGQFDQDIQTEVFEISAYPCGNLVSPMMERQYTFDINGLVKEKKLSITINYNRSEYRKETVERLAKCIKDSILNISQHCINKRHTEITPADLLYSDLSMEELDELVDDLQNIPD
jgi:non-ribosomal peptide synthase protein (TIGR01720 family)